MTEYTVLITLKDSDDEGVSLRVDIDPPMGTNEQNTPATYLAMEAVKAITQITEAANSLEEIKYDTTM